MEEEPVRKVSGHTRLEEVNVTQGCAYLSGYDGMAVHNHPLMYAVGSILGTVTVVARGVKREFGVDKLAEAFKCYQEALVFNNYPAQSIYDVVKQLESIQNDPPFRPELTK